MPIRFITITVYLPMKKEEEEEGASAAIPGPAEEDLAHQLVLSRAWVDGPSGSTTKYVVDVDVDDD
jgi:hypothetical protein